MPLVKTRFFFKDYKPCGKCYSLCDATNSIPCMLCSKPYHRKCLNLPKNKFHELKNVKNTFICNRCCSAQLPLFNCDSIDFSSAMLGEGLWPCSKCKRDCLDNMACIRCSVCLTWCHYECSGLTAKEFASNFYFFCNSKCENFNITFLPFNAVSNQELVTDGILLQPRLKNTNTKRKLKRSSKITKKINFDHFITEDHLLDIKCSYVSPNDIVNDHMSQNESDLTIFHNNIRSINKNLGSAEEIFLNCQKMPDILAFTETKLNSDSNLPNIEGYQPLEHVDSPTDAGGVGLFVRNDLPYTVRKDLSLKSPHCEDLWISIKNENNFVLGVIYRHPKNSYANFRDSLCKSLDILNKSKTDYVIVGDINIDFLKYNIATNITRYANALNSVGCNFFIDKATRITSNSASCIDHVYSNLEARCLENHVIMSDASDHFGTLTKVSGVDKTDIISDVYYRKTRLSDSDWQKFNTELTSQLSNAHNDQHDANLFANNIINAYSKVIDKFMPLKKLSRKQKRSHSKPWLTKGLKISIKRKNELYKLTRLKNIPRFLSLYKTYRNLITILKSKAHDNYYREKIALHGKNKSKIWAIVNQITKRRRIMSRKLKSILNEEGVRINDSLGIANRLNRHFGSVGAKMASNFNTKKANAKDPLRYISKRVNNSIFLANTDSTEILDLISKLLKKACGHDLISNTMLKHTAAVISPYIVSLFNLCLNQGIFPDSFKIAQVIPLFKGGNKEDSDCYRPISLLPALGKLFEKVISKRVIAFFEKYELFSPYQFGFRSKFSTEYAVHDIYEKLINNLDQGLSSCAIFLDLAKAFDSVSHNILLQKLKLYGIRGNVYKLFESYLSSRTQFVKVDDTLSDFVEMKFGVPQGSILGPLLFLIYINDLPESTNFFIKLFADDTFLCAQNKNFKALENEVNTELAKVSDWLVANKLTLNIKKSKFMIFSNKKKDRHELSVKINNKPLEKCSYYKYLGIIIDEKLNWGKHVEYVCKKVSKACGALAKIRHCASFDLLKEIYYALFYSYVRYGVSIWGNASPNVLTPLKVLNHRAARIMTYAPFGHIDMNPILNYLEILDINDVFFLETVKLLFKMKNGMIPITLGNYFEVRNANVIHQYSLRPRRDRVDTIDTRTMMGENSLQYRGPKAWNTVPECIRDCVSLNSFKKQMKSHLLQLRCAEEVPYFAELPEPEL